MPTLRDRFNKTVSQWHRAFYERTPRARTMRKAPLLLLTTIGRTSGQRRAVPLIYLVDGDQWAIVASNAGQQHDPDWYRNLQAQPLAEARIGDDEIPVTARTATDEERAELWPKLVAMFPGYAKYQRKVDRTIPVVILTRR